MAANKVVPAFCLLVIVAAVHSECALNTTKLYLMGLYPFGGTTWTGGKAMALATEIAFRDINADPNILTDYELVLVPTDSACDGGIATDAMYGELYNRTTTKIMILGGGCSLATEPTAQASHYWNLVQISTATSPLFSNRDIFPMLFRLLPSESVYNKVKFSMFRTFNWTKVATLHQAVPLFSLPTADLHRDAKQLGFEIIISESFINDPGVAIENLKNSGVRIIACGFYSDMGRKVFCEIYKHKMYGPKYVWIITGWLEALWWQAPDNTISCTKDQMNEAVAYHFGMYIDSFPSNQNRPPSLSGLTASSFVKEYDILWDLGDPKHYAGYTEITAVYDLAWTAALALHQAQHHLANLDPPRTLSDFAYDEVTGQILFDITSNTSFEGVSGPVKFDEFGDRLGLLQVLQLQGESFLGVGFVDPFDEGSGDDIHWKSRHTLIWPGGAPPIDFIIERIDRQTIALPVFVAGAFFAVVGIILACCFLAFNIHFRKIRVIKMSSPSINNLMLIGGILAYISIIINGVDTTIASMDTFLAMCKTRTWCLSIGFSMAFGSMFSKTWRVHKIFTNKTAMKTAVKDSWLLVCVVALIFIDAVILILWEIIDPVDVREQTGAKEVDEDNDDIVYIPIRMMCESSNQTYFIGMFYVIDGLLLVFGAFLAWETRKVSIPALNDSKYIGVCVYNVLILSFVGALISFVVEEPNAHYAAIATLVWLATTLTLCVVFVPKIRMRNDVRPTQNTMITGTTTQNTNTEDSQKELQLLRHEINQLKKKCSDQEEELMKVKAPSTPTA